MDSSVVMTVSLSLKPCAGMLGGQKGLQPDTSLKLGLEQEDADEESLD